MNHELVPALASGHPPNLRRFPPTRLYSGRAGALLRRALLVHRRAWWTIFLGFLEPLLYLLIVGNGLGRLAGPVTVAGAEPMSYVAFIAPGLLAASTMNGAVHATTMSIFFKLRHARLYDALLATPVTAGDIALGEIVWAALRGAVYAVGFSSVLVGWGLMSAPAVLLVVPAALLVAFAFGAVGLACTTFMRSWEDSQLVGLVTVPMLLFSTTFYPLSVYPPVLRFVVEISPLYQAIDLLRGLVSAPGLSLLSNVAYFTVLGVAGLAVASRRLERILLK